MMKLLYVVKWICLVLILVNLFFWGLYSASGHRIPVETNFFFRNNLFYLLLGLVTIIAIQFYLSKKNT